MTQMTQEQQQEQWEAAAEQVAAKLRTFHEGLTAGEQALLDRALRQVVADEQDLDVRGYANPVVVRVAAWVVVKVIDWIADGSLDDAPVFSTSATSSSNPEFQRGRWNGPKYQ